MHELGRLSGDEFREAEKMPVVVVLDNIRSLNNIGSIFRTSDAFLVEKIYLTGITGRPPHRDIHKTALGATETVDWEYNESPMEVVKVLKEKGYTIIAVEQTDDSFKLNEVPFHMPLALVFGNEVEGVSDEVIRLCDASVEIPQSGSKHSLNVSVCAGIVLWHFYQNQIYAKLNC